MISSLARKLAHLTFSSLYTIVKPKDFVLTGIPRSGTSLLSSLLCKPQDCFCFNEIHFDVRTLPFFFMKMRMRLLAGKPVPARIDEEGGLTTDTLRKGASVQQIQVPLKSSGLVLGSNVNALYLDQLDLILAYRYKVVVMVRNPIYTLASWNSEQVRAIPEASVMPDDLAFRWDKVDFSSQERVERQAEIWEHFAEVIWSIRHQVRIVRYEALTENQDDTLEDVTKYLGVGSLRMAKRLRNYNLDSRYTDLEKIGRAVQKFCVSKGNFGYY